MTNLTLVAFAISVVLLAILAAGAFKNRPASQGIWLLLTVALFQVLGQALTVMKLNGFAFSHPLLLRSTFPLKLASFTLLYLYIREISEREFTWRSVSLWNLAPTVVGVLWYFAILFWGAPELWQDSPEFYVEKTFRVAFMALVALPYVYLMWRNLEHLAERTKEFSSDLQSSKLTLMRFLLGLSCLGVGLSILHVLTGPHVIIWTYNSLIVLIGLVGLSYIGMSYSRLFEAEKVSGASLDSAELGRYKSLIVQKLKDEQLYRKPQLRLADLAESTGLKSYRVTEVIQRGLNTTFYDLVNRMRVEYAQRMLTSPDMGERFNLLGVAMESGFNSKSSFNDAFRRFVGMTPTQFKKTSGLSSPADL